MTEFMLTTVDNPFNPFTQFDQWLAYDTDAQYYTSSYLDRMTITSDDLSDADQAQAIQDAIDEIVGDNIIGLYKKVSNDSFAQPSTSSSSSDTSSTSDDDSS